MAPLNPAAAVGFILSIVASAPPLGSVDAFSLSVPTVSQLSGVHNRHHALQKDRLCHPSTSCSTSQLCMSDEEASAADDNTVTVDDASASEADGESEAEPAPPVDPEVAALKETIASLESDLKSKKYNLNSLRDMADKYTSAGYARQVAQTENNKRLRGNANTDGKSAARADVLRTFLPVFDQLDVVSAKYAGSDFARTLDAGIRSEIEAAMNELGVSEYAAEAGDNVDGARVVAVEEEHSGEFAKGKAIRALKGGLEISGNVIRAAEVVGSLGKEGEEDGAGGEQGEGGEDSE